MTRAECEAKLMKHMEAMVKILHKYNPECKYLSCSYSENHGEPHISMNNRCWGDGEDVMLPVSCFKTGNEPIYSWPLME